MYNYQYINEYRIEELIEYDLLVEDDENILPPYRFHINLREPVTPEDLQALAEQIITALTTPQ
jgi:hypothetical protein